MGWTWVFLGENEQRAKEQARLRSIAPCHVATARLRNTISCFWGAALHQRLALTSSWEAGVLTGRFSVR